MGRERVAAVKADFVAAGKPVAPRPVHLHRHTLGVGVGKQGSFRPFPCGRGRFPSVDTLQHPAISVGHLHDAVPRGAVRLFPPLAASVETRQTQTDVGTHLLPCERVFLLEQRGDVAGKACLAERDGTEYHSGNAGATRQFGHPLAQRRDAFPVHSTEGKEQMARLGKALHGRRGEPRQGRRVGFAKGGNVKDGRCEVGIHYLRPPRLCHAVLRRLRPEPITNARSQSAGAACTLNGHVQADTDCFQMTQTAAGVEHKGAAKSAVHHAPHALNRQGCLGNRRGQHHFPLALSRRKDGPSLLRRRQVAVERKHGGRTSLQHFGTLRDVRLPGEKGKNVAILLPERPPHSACHSLSHVAPVGVLLCINNIYGELPSLARYERCAESLTDGRRIDGGRHEKQAEVGPEQLLCLPRQSECEVGMQAAFVNFVEDDDAHTVECRVVLQHPRQDTLRQDLNLGVLAHTSIKADAVAHALSDLLSQQRCHALGNLSCGQTARLEHQNPALHGRILHKGKGQKGRFSGSRRRSHHGNRHVPKRLTHRLGYRQSWQLWQFISHNSQFIMFVSMRLHRALPNYEL